MVSPKEEHRMMSIDPFFFRNLSFELKFPYIDRILNQWLKDGLSLEDLNAGKRNAK